MFTSGTEKYPGGGKRSSLAAAAASESMAHGVDRSSRGGPAPTASIENSAASAHREAPNDNRVSRLARFDGRTMRSRPVGGFWKRALDISVATVALLLASPLMLMVIVLIKSADGGRVFYSHRRIGFKGRPFYCHKFRTMVENADELLANHLRENPSAQKEWDERRKLTNDPRVSLVGRLLRMSSMDELPQLLNVLRGEMSCVGPRPIVAEELDRYGEFAPDYLAAKPGLTGLWQISGRNQSTYAERVRLDSEYVRSCSLNCDLVILAKTAFAIMRFREAS